MYSILCPFDNTSKNHSFIFINRIFIEFKFNMVSHANSYVFFLRSQLKISHTEYLTFGCRRIGQFLILIALADGSRFFSGYWAIHSNFENLDSARFKWRETAQFHYTFTFELTIVMMFSSLINNIFKPKMIRHILPYSIVWIYLLSDGKYTFL